VHLGRSNMWPFCRKLSSSPPSLNRRWPSLPGRWSACEERSATAPHFSRSTSGSLQSDQVRSGKRRPVDFSHWCRVVCLQQCHL